MKKEVLTYLELLAEDYVITKEDSAAIKNAAETDYKPTLDESLAWDSILADEIWYNKGIIKLIDAKLPTIMDNESLLEDLLQARGEVQEKLDNYESQQLILSSKASLK